MVSSWSPTDDQMWSVSCCNTCPCPSQTLDFESKSSYTLHIEASNRHVDTRFLLVGPFRDITTVRLLVQNVDEPPVFSPSVSRMVVSEGAPVGGYVGSVSAHDPDVSNSPIR